jgi:hypothetical protein
MPHAGSNAHKHADSSPKTRKSGVHADSRPVSSEPASRQVSGRPPLGIASGDRPAAARARGLALKAMSANAGTFLQNSDKKGSRASQLFFQLRAQTRSGLAAGIAFSAGTALSPFSPLFNVLFSILFTAAFGPRCSEYMRAHSPSNLFLGGRLCSI